MTAGLISGMGSIADLTNVVNAASKAESDSGIAFSDMLKANSNKQTGTVENSKTKDNSTNVKKDNVEAREKDNTTYTKTERNIKSTKKVESTEEEINDDVMAAAAQAVEVISEVLGVTTGEVAEALDALGLAEADLLDTANLSQVIVEITGAEDALSIMTDENLYNNLKDITGQINDILANLEEGSNVSYEEIKDVIAKFSAREDSNQSFQIETTEVNENELNVEVPVEKSETKKEANNDQNSEGQMNWNESVVDNIKAVAGNTGEAEAVYSADMEQIYEQVTESMKLNLTKDVTEMEINLHPASLGNVKIQIAAKDGVITANFTTQNEAVKAALETQIVQLKENMAEQGIRVEAIEVAVAAHAFEENLSKEGESSGSNEAETKRKRRSINLNDIDDIDDNNIVEDDIRIAKEMMEQNGTTVDYMA